MKNVGIIGFGSIGSQIARSVDNRTLSLAKLSFVIDSSLNRLDFANSSLKNEKPLLISDADDLFSSDAYNDTHIVVESASRSAVRQFSRKILSDGKHLIIFSVGELVDEVFMRSLASEAKAHGATILIPSGAIAGIDAVRSARDHLDQLTISTTKSPKSLAGAPFFDIHTELRLNELTHRTVLYEGNVRNAVDSFPSNVNVFATLALAAGDMSKIRVRIIADPNIEVNRHEIVMRGRFGLIEIVVNNVPQLENPRTSRLAALSAIEAVRSACDEPVRIGT